MRQKEQIVALDNSRDSAAFDEWTNREVNPVNHNGKTKLVAWDLRSGKHPTLGEAWESIIINLVNYRP